MIARKDNERGQAIVLSVLALVALLGMSALVLDVGNWMRTKRRLQATADAATLAGAQALPSRETLAVVEGDDREAGLRRPQVERHVRSTLDWYEEDRPLADEPRLDRIAAYAAGRAVESA